MAEVPSNRSIPSGYDEEFLDPVDEDFECLICHLPSREPVLTRCGHRFCQQCLGEYLGREKEKGNQLTCPVDRNALDRITDIFPDEATKRKILSLVVKCQSVSCDWTGELRAIKNHLVSCVLELVPCTNQNCEVMVARKDLTEHLTVTCLWRIAMCNHCEERHPQCLIKSHQETCGKFPIPCPSDCGATISREEATMHIENDCPQIQVRCPFVCIGCNSKIRRGELESHLSRETRHHLDLACSKLKDTQKQAKENTRKHDRLERCHNQLQERVNILERQFEERVNNLERQFEETVNNLERQFGEKVNNLERQFGETVNNLNRNERNAGNEIKIGRKVFWITSLFFIVVVGVLFEIRTNQEVSAVQSQLEKRVDSVHKNLKKELNGVRSQLEKRVDGVHKNLKEELNGVRSQLEKRVNFVQKTLANEVHTLTWKITDFKFVLKKAKRGYPKILEHEPFYWHGYKLKFYICPNGCHGGEDTHLSLFLVIMKGENDAMLPWPFLKKVEFRLVDQQEDPKERENVVVSFTGKKELKEVFGRPVNDENVKAYGSAAFVSHEKLKARRYIVDNTLFIQIEVS